VRKAWVMRRWNVVVCLTVVSLAAVAWAQDDEATRADALFQQGKRVDALPLYEDLSRTNPKEMLYAERLADCLGAAATQTDDAAQMKALRTRQRDAARLAVQLGDKAVFVQQMANLDPDTPLYAGIVSPGKDLLAEAEKAYTAGDFPAAMEKYVAAAQADPHLYEAPLYAGDTAYVQKDLPTAAHWFTIAIQIDPNRETAYRYWGDAIMKYGNDPAAAREKFIEAIVAEPYNKYAWQGLNQWAQTEKAVILASKIDRPAAPVVDPKNSKNITINVNPADALNKNDQGSFAWMAYSIKRALYRGDEFSKQFPDEKEYRHSLKEEDDALSVVVSVLKERKIKRDSLDESLRNLLDLLSLA
jgi:hypothetical protein